MQETSALERVMTVVRDLRIRCDWDRAQTRATLRPYLVEEVLELDHAIGNEDRPAIREEMGDFLLHLAWQLVLAEELGEFTADELARATEVKMQRRHPHLFDLGPRGGWEEVKRRERARGVLDGLPPTLPSLLMAYRLQERAASVGFDWPDTTGPAGKVREELEEVERELLEIRDTSPGGGDTERGLLAAEIGDLLFAVVNLARKSGVDPSGALDGANRKFRTRFAMVEALAAERGQELHAAGLESLDRLWDEAKARERADRGAERPS
jgi:MazG family protein